MTGPEDLQADYLAAGFAGSLGSGSRRALIVVDFVNAYLDTSSPLYAGVEEALASAVRLLEAARSGGTPVYFTKVDFDPADTNLFARKVPSLQCFAPGQPLADYPSELAPRPGEMVVAKRYASAFFGTHLASSLTARGIDALVIVGVTTSGCIRATALDALQHGFIPLVVSDACGDRDRRPHEANLFDLQAKYAEVIPEAVAHDLLAQPVGDGRLA
jgi:maleamate amidohydrolase